MNDSACLGQVCKIPLRLLGQVKDATWNASQLSAAVGDHLTLTLLYVYQFTISLDIDHEMVSFSSLLLVL